MNKKLLSLIGAAAFMLSMSSGWAQSLPPPPPPPPDPCDPSWGGAFCPPADGGGVGVPEIDIGAGGSAIALLVGALLLAGEKRRRSS